MWAVASLIVPINFYEHETQKNVLHICKLVFHVLLVALKSAIAPHSSDAHALKKRKITTKMTTCLMSAIFDATEVVLAVPILQGLIDMQKCYGTWAM